MLSFFNKKESSRACGQPGDTYTSNYPIRYIGIDFLEITHNKIFQVKSYRKLGRLVDEGGLTLSQVSDDEFKFNIFKSLEQF